MPGKMQLYAQMADQAAKQITGSYQSLSRPTVGTDRRLVVLP